MCSWHVRGARTVLNPTDMGSVLCKHWFYFACANNWTTRMFHFNASTNNNRTQIHSNISSRTICVRVNVISPASKRKGERERKKHLRTWLDWYFLFALKEIICVRHSIECQDNENLLVSKFNYTNLQTVTFVRFHLIMSHQSGSHSFNFYFKFFFRGVSLCVCYLRFISVIRRNFYHLVDL